MKKLNVIFLYLMLATASAHGMMANVICLFFAIAPYAKPYVITSEGLPNFFALSNGKDRAISFLSLCLAKIDHFGGDKCGLWKSSERLQKEKEEADFKKATRDLTDRLNLEKEKELFDLRQKFTEEKTNIILEQRTLFIKEIEKEKQEKDELREQLREFQNKQLVHQTIAEMTKRHSEELERLSTENKTLSQKINIKTYLDQISQLTEEKKNLENKVKELTFTLSVKNSDFPSFNDQSFNFKQKTYGYNRLNE